MKFLAAVLVTAALLGCTQTPHEQHRKATPRQTTATTAPATTTPSTLPPAPTTAPPPPPTDPPPAEPAPVPDPPPPAHPSPSPAAPAIVSDVLACIRGHETANYPDPWAVNTGNGYYGAYQWLPSSWNSAAASVGRGDLVGRLPVKPSVSAGDQDSVTLAYHNQVGDGPWGNQC